MAFAGSGMSAASVGCGISFAGSAAISVGSIPADSISVGFGTSLAGSAVGSISVGFGISFAAAIPPAPITTSDSVLRTQPGPPPTFAGDSLAVLCRWASRHFSSIGGIELYRNGPKSYQKISGVNNSDSDIQLVQWKNTEKTSISHLTKETNSVKGSRSCLNRDNSLVPFFLCYLSIQEFLREVRVGRSGFIFHNSPERAYVTADGEAEVESGLFLTRCLEASVQVRFYLPSLRGHITEEL